MTTLPHRYPNQDLQSTGCVLRVDNMKRRFTRYHAVKQIERRLLDLHASLIHSEDSEFFEAVSRAAGQAGRIASLVLHGKM